MFLTLSIKAIVKQWTVSLWQGTVEFGRPYNRMLTIVPGQKWKDLRTTLSPTFSALKMKQVCMYLLNILSVYKKTFRYMTWIKIEDWIASSLCNLKAPNEHWGTGQECACILWQSLSLLTLKRCTLCNCRSSIFSNAFSLENCRDGNCRNSIVFRSRVFTLLDGQRSHGWSCFAEWIWEESFNHQTDSKAELSTWIYSPPFFVSEKMFKSIAVYTQRIELLNWNDRRVIDCNKLCKDDLGDTSAN